MERSRAPASRVAVAYAIGFCSVTAVAILFTRQAYAACTVGCEEYNRLVTSSTVMFHYWPWTAANNVKGGNPYYHADYQEAIIAYKYSGCADCDCYLVDCSPRCVGTCVGCGDDHPETEAVAPTYCEVGAPI